MSLQFLDRIIAVQNANWIGWQRFVSGTSTLSTFTVAVLISVIDVFLFLIFAAKIIDSIASEKLRIGLEEDEDLAVLQRIEKLKGQRFVIDKELDWMEPVHDIANENKADGETSNQRISFLSYVFPLRVVCHSAKSPAFGLLDRDTHASHEDNFQAAQVQKILSQFEEICGPAASSFKRFWILRGVILRYFLLKLYFDLSWIAPFTRYDQFRSRASRLTLKLGLLGTSFWATMAFYSFKSNAVGVVADSNALSFLDLLIYNILAVIFQQFILVFITQLITNASETSFRYRFPFVYAEMKRRQASELRFSAMTPEELEEALREAQALQDAAVASLKNTSSIEQIGKDALSVVEAVAEEHVTSTEARLLAAEQEAEAKAAAAAKKKMTPLLAKAAISVLTQRPSPADLLSAAAAPFLLSNPKIALEPSSRDMVSSMTDYESMGDSSRGVEKSDEEVSKVMSSAVDESSSELPSIDRDASKEEVVVQQNPSTSSGIPPAPPRISFQCCSTCCSRLRCGCMCFRRIALKNSSSAVEAVRSAQKRAAQIAIEAEARASKLFEEAEREARLIFAKRGSPLLTPFALQFLVFLIFTFFVIYWILFSLAQGDAIIIEESSNWLYWTIVLGPLIPEPTLFLVSILGQLVIWPSWQPFLTSFPGSLGRMFQSNDTDPNAPNRKKKKGRGVGGESITRAAGLASSFPPALAALAFAVTAAASTAVTAASNSVVNAATTSAAETAADAIADAEEDAKKIAEEEEEERKNEDEVKKHNKEVEEEEKWRKAGKEERRKETKSDYKGSPSTDVPALDTEKSRPRSKAKSTHRKLKPKPVVTPEMRDLLIVKAPAVIKVQAAEKVAQAIAAHSANIVDDEMLKRIRQERMREEDELHLMRVEDTNSLIIESSRKGRDYQKRREDEERMLEVQMSKKSDLENRNQHDEHSRAAQLELDEQERIRLIEEENRLLEEKENLLRLLEEEKEQEHHLADDVAERQRQQEESEKRDEEMRNQSLQEKEMLEAQLEMEDEEASKGLIGEIEGGEDELVEGEIGVEASEGVASTGTKRRGESFQDLT
jgi:hypothetical protein